ncbi:hypothetical protein DFJ74DRAFT_655943 [Hyaloraphidium curvatum]|nr:hypothetical protein DFJ74DRAFT_655943 [Hyaloraphidium curvatum]
MELLWKEVSLTLDPVAPNSSIRKWKGFLAGAKKKSQWELVNELDLGRAVRGWQLQPEALKVQLSVLDQLRNLEVLKMDARYEQYWPKVERLSALRVLWITVRDRDSAAWLRSVSIPKTVHELHLQEFTGVFDMEDNFRALYRSIGASASVVDVHFAGTPSRALFCDAFVAKIRSFDLGRNRPGHFGPLVAHASFRPAELKLNRTSDWDRLDWSAINNMAGLERLVLNGFTHTFLPESFPKVEELELIYQHRPKDGIQCDARHCTVLAEPDPDYWRSIGKVHVDWQIPKPEDGFCFTAGGRSLRDDSLKRWESERAFWKKVAALTGGRFH